MAKQKQDSSKKAHDSVHKRTKQGGWPKTSSMNKSQKRSHNKELEL